MALIKAVITSFSGDAPNGDQTMSVVTWTGITSTSTCEAVKLAHWADRSVQLEGSFSSGTITITGSNSGNAYATLHDMFSNSLEFTAAGLSQICEVTGYVKPAISGGGAGTSITITMLCRRPQDLLVIPPGA